MSVRRRAAGVCLLLLILFASGLPPTPPAVASDLPWRDKSSPFGVVATIGNRVRAEDVPAAVALMREAGVQWQREEIFWDRVQKEPGGPFIWNGDGSGLYDYDRAIAEQHAAGMNILGLLDYNPYWFKSRNPHPDEWIDDWYTYVYETVSRYGRDRGQIQYWELWNEPNVRESGYESGLYEIKHFVRVLEVGHAAVKAADPEARIVMAGMSGLTEINKPFDYDGLYYLDQVGQLGGWQYVDIIALHPYHPAAPEATIQRFDRTVTLRDELTYLDELLRRYGAKPVWLTELGWSTSRGSPGVSETDQALYLVRAYMLALAHPSVEKIFWYDFRNDTHPDAPYTDPVYDAYNFEFHYGLLRRSYPLDPYRADLRKPAFVAFRAMTNLLGGLTLHQIAADGDLPDAPGVYWYHFMSDTRRVDVLWRVSDAQPVFALDCGCREAVVRSWEGRLLRVLPAENGQVRLQPGVIGQPIYIEYDPPIAPDGHMFPATGHTLRGAFLPAWYGRGDLTRFGYPITEELIEPEIGSGRPRVVQYFERARFEHYAELTGTPGEIQSASLDLGVLALAQSGIEPALLPNQGNPAECRLFSVAEPALATQPYTVQLCPPFRAVWEKYEAIAPPGQPISSAFVWQDPATGTQRMVQYFEHSRLEHFPEFAGTPFEVQFGLLGRELFISSGN